MMIRVRLYKHDGEDGEVSPKPFRAFRSEGISWPFVKTITAAMREEPEVPITVEGVIPTNDAMVTIRVEVEEIKLGNSADVIVMRMLKELEEEPDLVQQRIDKGQY